MEPLTYPTPPTADQVDDYHGTPIADPYRPLEDSDAPETRAWIEAAERADRAVLGRRPARDAIRDRLAELWDYPRAGAPWRRGDRWFQLRNTGLQDQDVLWTADAPDAEGRVLLDPNAPQRSGTTALIAIDASRQRRALSRVATERRGLGLATWRVRRRRDGEELPDRIPWSKFSSAAWTHDDAGFFYGRYPEPPADAAYDAPNLDMELRYHRLGTDPAEDPRGLRHARPSPSGASSPEVSDDGRLLVVTIWRGTDPENRIYVADLRDGVDGRRAGPAPRCGRRPLRARRDDRRDDLPPHRPRRAARPGDRRRRRRSRIARARSSRRHDDALERVPLVGDRLAAVYLHDAHHRLVAVRARRPPVVDVALPGIGTIVEHAGRPARRPELFLRSMTFAAPPSVLAVAIADGAVREVGGRRLAWDPDDFVTRAGVRRPPTTGPGSRCS